MKTSEFIRQLKKQGIKFLKHGTNHDWYINPLNGKITQIGRHVTEDIRKGMMNRILKDLGLK